MLGTGSLRTFFGPDRGPFQPVVLELKAEELGARGREAFFCPWIHFCAALCVKAGVPLSMACGFALRYPKSLLARHVQHFSPPFRALIKLDKNCAHTI